MPYLTPPPTEHKLGFFSGSPPSTSRRSILKQTPRYYEDIYGIFNEDEELEGEPEHCESEGDSDDGRIGVGMGQRMVGRLGRTSGMVSDPESDSDEDMEEQEEDDEIEEVVKAEEDEEVEGIDKVEYRIAPNVNGKQSVPVQKAKESKTTDMLGYSQDDNSLNNSDADEDGDMIQSADEEPHEDEEGEEGDIIEVTQAPQRQRQRKVEKSRRGMNATRPESRRLLKQQLADHDKKKKLARRADIREKVEQRKALRRAGAAAAGGSKNATSKVQKSTSLAKGSRGGAKAGSRTSKVPQAPKGKTMVVVIDNSAIDVRDYTYISD